jgi:hypothetical protein
MKEKKPNESGRKPELDVNTIVNSYGPLLTKNGIETEVGRCVRMGWTSPEDLASAAKSDRMAEVLASTDWGLYAPDQR